MATASGYLTDARLALKFIVSNYRRAAANEFEVLQAVETAIADLRGFKDHYRSERATKRVKRATKRVKRGVA